MALDRKKAAAASIAAILAGVFAVEGGYVNDPRDPGGETNMGITKRVAVAHGYTGPMRDLPRGKAGEIYIASYIDGPGYRPMIDIEPVVAEELVDTAVNMGPAKPSRWFQAGLNRLGQAHLAVDGRVGPATIRAYQSLQARAGRVTACTAMLDWLDAQQAREYARLVQVKPGLKVYYKGWMAARIGNADRRKCGSDVL